MKGRENVAYTEDESEGKNNVSNTEIELKMENRLEPNRMEEDQTINSGSKKDQDICSRTIINIRSGIFNFFKKHKKPIQFLFNIGFNILSLCYLMAVIIIYNKKGYDGDYWRGPGLLIIIYALVYGCLFYYNAIKPNLGSKFSAYIVKPLKKLFLYLFRVRLLKWIFCLIPFILIGIYLFFESSKTPKKLVSFSGILVFILFGFVFSRTPGHINWRPVYTGLILQFIFGIIVIRWETGRAVLQHFSDHVSMFLDYTKNGTQFIYGPLVGENFQNNYGTIFAFTVLPVIYFFAFVTNILSYYGALQWVILKLASIIQPIMGTTVCESVNAAANIFISGTESVLLFHHQIKDLTKSELHAIMCEGMSTVAGSVLAAYISFGVSASHLIAASVMSAPAALSYSKLFYPETEISKTNFQNIVLVNEEAENVLDAACQGATKAFSLVSNIIANLIAFISFMAFLDNAVNWLGVLLDFPQLSFQYLLTKLFIPISFLMGVDNESIEDVALLVGIKTFVNEFRAYEVMKTMKHKFSARTETIATYALCGFSNFSTIGIFIGMFAAIAPSKVPEATEVAIRALIAANMVCCITACVAGTIADV